MAWAWAALPLLLLPTVRRLIEWWEGWGRRGEGGRVREGRRGPPKHLAVAEGRVGVEREWEATASKESNESRGKGGEAGAMPAPRPGQRATLSPLQRQRWRLLRLVLSLLLLQERMP